MALVEKPEIDEDESLEFGDTVRCGGRLGSVSVSVFTGSNAAGIDDEDEDDVDGNDAGGVVFVGFVVLAASTMILVSVALVEVLISAFVSGFSVVVFVMMPSSSFTLVISTTSYW
ncbi:hypothetical protein F4677DRAFT_449200 [Hypoxylon crocopeplum]|nr:hypothetical protein F4677DRAFT_449200 [Hypoxylon crocopeplum]